MTEKNGWLYPREVIRQNSIPELLLLRARSLKVKIKTREKAEKCLSVEQNTWKVQTEGWTYEGDAVILANGSKASQVPGSDGSGYVACRETWAFGILRPLPALTGLKAAREMFFSAWAGVRTEGKATLLMDGWNDICTAKPGELQLTEYGISGIPVFQISRACSPGHWIRKQKSVCSH